MSEVIVELEDLERRTAVLFIRHDDFISVLQGKAHVEPGLIPNDARYTGRNQYVIERDAHGFVFAHPDFEPVLEAAAMTPINAKVFPVSLEEN